MKRLITGLAVAVLVALVPSAALADDLPCTVFGTDGDDIWTVVPNGDWVLISYDAVVCGGDGDDVIMGGAFQGTFYGGKGDDGVQSSRGATFYGGDGGDWMGDNLGSFYGGDGNDSVYRNAVEFYGGDGNDSVYKNYGEFYGGDGEDVVFSYQGGTFVQGD
jgi:Ca2+-binding RTX toxin-like protein